MIQTIDFAPLDGITKIVFRQVWSQFFGGVDRYFIPFFSPTPHHLMTPRDLREVDYIHNANLPSVPQVMTKNADDFLWASSFGWARNPEPLPLAVTVPEGQPRFRLTSV